MRKLHDTETAIIENWSVDEAIAVYEFSTLVLDHLWRLHSYELREHLYSREDTTAAEPLSEQDMAYLMNLQLPLDDLDDIQF